MDWKTFISELIKALVWPTLIFSGLILFKKQISSILIEFSKYPYLKWKRGENEIELGVHQITEGTKDINLDEGEEDIVKSISKAVVNPQNAIKEAWEVVEKTAKETAGVNNSHPFELENILKENFKLPEDKFKLYVKLKEIGQQAVQASPTTVTSSTAVDYSASALKLSKYLKDKKK